MRTRVFQVAVATAQEPGYDVELIEGVKISTEAGVLLVWGDNPDPRTSGLFGAVVTKMYAPGQWLTAVEDQVQ